MDERVRRELREQADLIRPDVETDLAAAVARGTVRHRSRVGPLLAAASVAVLLVIVVQLAFLGTTHMPVGPGTTPSPLGAALVGRYSLELADTGVVHANGLAGTWTLELRPDGVLLMTPPTTYPGGGQPLSGFSYSVSQGALRTNLFAEPCGSVATYTWERSGTALSFDPTQDDCDLRRTLLATAAWTALR